MPKELPIFLKAFPPFDQLSKKDLILISGEVTIPYIEKDKAVHRSGDLLHDKFYVINKGAIALKKNKSKFGFMQQNIPLTHTRKSFSN